MAPSWWGFVLAGLMFVSSMMQTLILHQYYHSIFVMALRLRTAIIGVIYRKVSQSGTHAGRGQFWAAWERLMGSVHLLLFVCRLWSSPTQSNVSPLWEKWSTSCQWMLSASWMFPPSSTCCGQLPCRSSWLYTSSGR